MNKNVNGYNHSVGNRETTSETLLGNNYEHCCCCKEWFVGLLYFTQLHRQAADQQKSIVKGYVYMFPCGHRVFRYFKN